MTTGPHTSTNVLLTSAGQRVSLLRSYKAALRALGVPGRVVVADMCETAPAIHAADASAIVPRADHPAYVDRLLEVCETHQISLLVPLIDPELPVLAAARDEFAKEGVRVVVSCERTTEIAQDKRLTNDFLRDAGFGTPKIFDTLGDEYPSSFPVVVKPADGSSSVLFHRVESREELDFILPRVPNAIVQEFVRGDEYTLDVLADFQGVPLCVVPRRRVKVASGESVKGETVRDPRLIDVGRRVVAALPGPVGCITVQCFVSHGGEVQVIEINPRFGGGFPLSDAAGAHYPKWILEFHLGLDPEIDPEDWEDGLTMLRYHEAFFVSSHR